MAASLITRVNLALQRLDHAIAAFFNKGFPPDGFCIAATNSEVYPQPPSNNITINDIIGDGFLWAVPRNRRTIEKRWKRRFGHPDYVLKILLPRKNLRVCNVCGDDHEVGVLCPTCYKKVIDETKEMQDAIQNELRLSPVEKEVVVLYDGEKNEKPSEYWQGKRVVEMKKSRPAWFSKNLLQQTTQQPATTTDVKPSDLG
ncbi:hypothetical protein ILUMI_00656 [Ignelater luminosus]|uniref:Large ribosomal subunit protein bL32m n=1 Tax=Ignelater luminosus TaxID=2038154 RepID=A0A8K0DLV9_IGNLU|nr:hypothetical protein ILUMI_00656 [Ignelater luminosus]